MDLKDSIELVGYQKNIYSYLRKADIYLQGSEVEGFPNVLLEAGSVGVPAVAFRVPGGTRDIITEGINGYLVDDNDIDGYVEKVKMLVEKPLDRKKIVAFTNQNFSLIKMLEQYRSLLNKTNTF